MPLLTVRPLLAVTRPVTPRVLPSVVAPVTPSVLLRVVAPVTSSVLLRVVAPVTPRVLLRVVAPVTPRVLLKVEGPVTPSVPPTVALLVTPRLLRVAELVVTSVLSVVEPSTVKLPVIVPEVKIKLPAVRLLKLPLLAVKLKLCMSPEVKMLMLAARSAPTIVPSRILLEVTASLVIRPLVMLKGETAPVIQEAPSNSSSELLPLLKRSAP